MRPVAAETPRSQTATPPDWDALWSEARTETDYARFLKLCRRRQRLLGEGPAPTFSKTVKLAILGGATTELLAAPLQLCLESLGLGSRFEQAAYNTFHREMTDPGSAMVAFAPEVALVVCGTENMPAWPAAGDDHSRVARLVDEVCDYWLGLCQRFHDHCGAEIILNNFHLLETRPIGNLGAKLPWEPNNFIRRVNLALGDRAPAWVHINDVFSLSAELGIRRWRDPRLWCHAKQPVSFECLIPYVRNTAQIVGAMYGRSAKCLVLDLDNTLWGGVIGDDGVDGIAIGEGDAVGEAYLSFQKYVRALKDRGVILAVCSKNDEANALEAFEKRADMLLKRSDFSAFKANWRHKPDNIREIAAELNIGLDALVFVDDNPIERDLVRKSLPPVRVIELGEDPADYPRLVEAAGAFEITALSAEDRARAGQYADNTRRSKLLESVGDYETYLKTLEQKAVVRGFEERYLERITQLINKSNQFNLTTLRLTRSEVERRMRDPDAFTVYVRLADKFGDNGLICVVHGMHREDHLHIENWLMSCRVLNRGVERLVCNHLVTLALERGIPRVEGVYVPTAKNQMVREHYASLGFSSVGGAREGTTHWRLIAGEHRPVVVPIQLVEEY